MNAQFRLVFLVALILLAGMACTAPTPSPTPTPTPTPTSSPLPTPTPAPTPTLTPIAPTSTPLPAPAPSQAGAPGGASRECIQRVLGRLPPPPPSEEERQRIRQACGPAVGTEGATPTPTPTPTPPPTPTAPSTPSPAPKPLVRPKVTGVIVVGHHPRGVAVNPATNRVYVANSNRMNPFSDPKPRALPISKEDSLSVIDGDSGNVIATIPMEGAPHGVAVNPMTGRIYVAAYEAGSVYVIDGETNTVVTRVPVTERPQELAVNPTTNRVYVTHDDEVASKGSRTVTVIDGVSNTVVASLKVGEAHQSVDGVAVDAAANRVYVIHGGLTVLDGASNAVISTTGRIGEGPEGGTRGIAVDPASGRIYVSLRVENTVTVIDGVTHSVVTRIPIGKEGINPRRLALDSKTGLVYVAYEDDDQLWVIDVKNNKVLSTVAAGGGGLGGVAVNPVTGRAYVAEWNRGSVAVIGELPPAPRVITPLVFPEVIDAILVGVTPTGVAVNPNTNRIYVANWNRKDNKPVPNGDTVSVIDGHSGNVIATIPAEGAPNGVAVNPMTDRIYVAAHEAGSVYVIDGETNTVVTTVPVTERPGEVAVNPTTSRVYVTHAEEYAVSVKDQFVSVIDGASNTVVAILRGFNQPQGVAVDPTANRVYIADSVGGGRVTVLEGTSDAVIATIRNVGSGLTGMAVDPARNRIYVALMMEDSVGVIDSVTNTVVGKISVGRNPWRVAVDSKTGLVYVTDHQDDLLWVIDGATVGNISVGRSPWRLTVDPKTGLIHISDSNDDLVWVIDGTANKMLTKVRTGGGPSGIAVNPVTGRAYKAQVGFNSVVVIGEPPPRPRPGPHVIGIIEIEGNTGAGRMGINPSANRVYVGTPWTKTLTVIDETSLTVVATVPVGNSYGAAVLPGLARFYVPNGEDRVSVIDAALAEREPAKAVIATLVVGSGPSGIGANAQTNRVYVTNVGGASVSVIDGASNQVVATIPVGQAPMGVAANTITNRIYVANQISEKEAFKEHGEKGFVSVIDGNTNKVIANVPMGLVPKGVAVNPNTNRVYVTNWGESSVRVIDGATNQVVAVIPVRGGLGGGPFMIAVNPTTNRVYVGTEYPRMVSVLDGETNKVIAEVLGGGRSVTVNPLTNRVYASDQASSSLTVIEDTLEPR